MMKLVYIKWADSLGCNPDWQELKTDTSKVLYCICESVGWLLHNGGDCKVLVPHIERDKKQGCGNMTIPTVCIIEMKDLDFV